MTIFEHSVLIKKPQCNCAAAGLLPTNIAVVGSNTIFLYKIILTLGFRSTAITPATEITGL